MIAAIQRSSPAPNLREDYLDGLPEPQELFVENLVAAGRWWSIDRNDAEIGYAVTDGDETLVELHLGGAHLGDLSRAFDALVEAAGVRQVLAKTFDATLLSAAFARQRELRTVGLLFRDIANTGFDADTLVTARGGADADTQLLLELGSDFFDSVAEIEDYIRSDGLMIYETHEGVALGAGVLKRVISGRDDIDIGMVVHPAHRGLGHGAYIIGHLKALCLGRGWRPICGCSVENPASQRALERAGFATRHRLVEFQL